MQPEGWINVDGSMRAKLASRLSPIDSLLTKLRIFPPTEFNRKTRILDLRKRLPFDDNSVDAIYAGELWEHFEIGDARRLTHECYRVLKTGGVLRVCVPDGVEFWRTYLEKFDLEMGKSRQMRDSTELANHVGMYFRDICTRRIWFGSLGHVHKWQYDELQLIDLFESAGFSSVGRRRFHESQIEDVASVERSDFLIVEGLKQ